MTKETITYTDLNGVQRTEDFYFDLSKPEIVKMQASAQGWLRCSAQEYRCQSEWGAYYGVLRELY